MMVKPTELHHEGKKTEKLSKEGTGHEPSMRIGASYQAEVPEMNNVDVNDADVRPEPLLIWAPCDHIPDSKLNEYLKISKEKFGYSMEQSLGLLYWHKYELDKAIEDLKNFTPLPDEWSMEDKVVFDQSFHSYGKHFPRIHQQLPDKSLGTLVKYYYSWKKNRNKKSLMDKGEKRDMSIINGIFADDSNNENESSDSDYEPNDKKMKNSKPSEKLASPTSMKPSPMLSTNCVNCAGVTSQMNSTPRGKMCVPCYDYWRRTGILRPKYKENPISLYHGPQHKLKRKPPKGMQLKQEALMEVAQVHGDSHIRPLEIELINLRRQIVSGLQVTQQQDRALDGRAERCHIHEPTPKINPRWTNEELLIAVQCVRRYGRDFNAMAEILSNKTASHCRSFFLNYRRRFNLMDILSEYEKENNIQRSALEAWDEVDMETTDANVYPVANEISLHQVNSQGPSRPPTLHGPLQRMPLNDVPQGPPPLVTKLTK